MFTALTTYINERKAIRALSRLSDRELGDVGIARDSIGAVVRSGMTFGSNEEPALAKSWAVQNRRALSV